MVAEQRWSTPASRSGSVRGAKLFPIVYVPFLVARLLRENRHGALRRLVVSLLATCVAVNLPFCITAYHNWTFFFAFNASRSAAGILGCSAIMWPLRMP